MSPSAREAARADEAGGAEQADEAEEVEEAEEAGKRGNVPLYDPQVANGEGQTFQFRAYTALVVVYI